MIFTQAPSKDAREEFFKRINEKRKNMDTGVLARSILGNDIHYYKIGTGKRIILSVAAHHAMEHISAAVLFNVIDKISEKMTRDAMSYGVDISFLLQKFTFWFVPCLNVDGVQMVISGVGESPIYERQLKMNGGRDFSLWQSNARGVDLNHNYDFGFWEYKRLESEAGIEAGKTRYSGEYPESEPETRALVSLIKIIRPEVILSFHTQGEEFFFRPRRNEYVLHLAEKCARSMCYKVSTPEGLADYGGLSDYAGEVLGIPSFTVELGKGKNPLPYTMLKGLTERVYKLHCLLPTYL